MLEGQYIIDADGHVRDHEHLLKPFVDPEYRERQFYFPRDGFDRAMGGKLGFYDVNPPDQIRAMDDEGIDLQVLFPTNGLFLGEIHEPKYSVAICRAYNDWMHTFCQHDPKRLKGVAIVPPVPRVRRMARFTMPRVVL